MCIHLDAAALVELRKRRESSNGGVVDIVCSISNGPEAAAEQDSVARLENPDTIAATGEVEPSEWRFGN